jgi:hypothetical protein
MITPTDNRRQDDEHSPRAWRGEFVGVIVQRELPREEEIVEHIDQIAELGITQSIGERVRIGISEGYFSNALAAAIRRVMEQHPTLQIELHVSLTKLLLDQFDDGLSVYGFTKKPSSLIARQTSGFQLLHPFCTSSAWMPVTISGAGQNKNGNRRDSVLSWRISHRDMPPKTGEWSAKTTRPMPAARIQNEHMAQGSTEE